MPYTNSEKSGGYKAKPTQENRILDLLKERGSAGAFIWEFMTPRDKGGLGIAQYSSRIWALRQKGYKIKSVKKGHFVLLNSDNEYTNEGGQGERNDQKARHENNKSEMQGRMREIAHQQSIEIQPKNIRNATLF